jgi:outer membrane receptor protein involved in Fe transport
MLRAILWGSTALTAALAAGTASAQAQAGAAPNALEEIVVTATRQADTVNRVPLSITAVTQRSLDEQGLKEARDLSRTVPALVITRGNNATDAGNITIRGIASNTGAPTTGVYIDDTPLQKRNVTGAFTGNGTPTPVLFDLERIEVLRGPQGTLYGGSSEGGTLRFITPAPSLTRYSAYARGELSHTEHGDESYEAGVAAGGPIVADKLGFRASVFGRHTGGYMDHVDVYNNGATLLKDANDGDAYAMRGAVLFAPTESLRATLAYYGSREVRRGTENFNLPVDTEITVPERCYRTSVAPVACTTPGAYRYPKTVYGPFPFLGPFKTIQPKSGKVVQTLDTPSLTLEYVAKGGWSVKSITSYIDDQTRSVSYDTSPTNTQVIQIPGIVQNIRGVALLREFPDYAGTVLNRNKRHGMSQEVRFATGDTRPVSFVGGVFYSHFNQHSAYDNIEDLESIDQILFGFGTAPRYSGQSLLPGGISAHRDQLLADEEIAAFGEANWWVTPKLKLTGGLRVSKVSFDFTQVFYGPIAGWNVPTVANTGIVEGGISEKPVTPKVGVQYQLTDRDMVYATAAKGFRPGGVNSPVSASVCTGLPSLGLTSADLPTTYDSDSVWSYEGGGKFRLLGGRMQLNASAFWIDWKGVQTTVTVPGCGQNFVTNAGSARSRGVDIEAQARLPAGFSLNVAFGYTDAEYTADALGPEPKNGTPATRVAAKGDPLPVPPVNLSVGLRYDFMLAGLNAYARGDYQYSGSYKRTTGPGTASFAPDTREADAADIVNVRVGVTKGAWGADLFVNNLTNSRDFLGESGGRSQCAIATGAACTTYNNYNPLFTASTYRPREFGVQVSYRY